MRDTASSRVSPPIVLKKLNQTSQFTVVQYVKIPNRHGGRRRRRCTFGSFAAASERRRPHVGRARPRRGGGRHRRGVVNLYVKFTHVPPVSVPRLEHCAWRSLLSRSVLVLIEDALRLVPVVGRNSASLGFAPPVSSWERVECRPCPRRPGQRRMLNRATLTSSRSRPCSRPTRRQTRATSSSRALCSTTIFLADPIAERQGARGRTLRRICRPLDAGAGGGGRRSSGQRREKFSHRGSGEREAFHTIRGICGSAIGLVD